MWGQIQRSAFDDDECVATYRGGPLNVKREMCKAQARTTELDKIASSITERQGGKYFSNNKRSAFVT